MVAVGDPLQLRAVGVGGAFARIHQLVGGLVLEENRGQRDLVEREALHQWRQGRCTAALRTVAGHGHVHAADTQDQALAAMVTAWDTARQRWAGDPHGETDDLLPAARRTDVAARQLRQHAGELTDARRFPLAGDAGSTWSPRRPGHASGRVPHAMRCGPCRSPPAQRARRAGETADRTCGMFAWNLSRA